jgi:Leucine-rich repeat (LRR) protein
LGFENAVNQQTMNQDFNLSIWQSLSPEWKDIFAINLVANVRLNVNLRSKIFKVGQNPFECFKAYFGKKFVNNLTDEEILQLPSLKILYLADLGIDSIPFTTYFSELEFLDICLNRFDSIPFLTNFPKLKSFYAEVNKIKTITELQNLRELEELNLRENCVTSVAHLQNLEKLTYLDVGRNKIEEIAVLSGLKNVIELQIDYNEVKDCEAICQLEALNILVLNDNPVQNLEKLIALKNIHYLSIQNTSEKSEEVALFFQSKIGIENVKS